MIRVVNEQKCSGCYLCALACSFYTTPERQFNLSTAMIRIERVDKENKFRPVLSEVCLNCVSHKCMDFCTFGVLTDE